MKRYRQGLVPRPGTQYRLHSRWDISTVLGTFWAQHILNAHSIIAHMQNQWQSGVELKKLYPWLTRYIQRCIYLLDLHKSVERDFSHHLAQILFELRKGRLRERCLLRLGLVAQACNPSTLGG